MTVANAVELLNNTPVDEELPPSQSLMQQYEKMIVKTLLQSFALDFMITDQDGGNVDTPLTARKFGFKDEEAQKRFEKSGKYEDHKDAYHSAANYKARNKQAADLKDSGQLVDSYTGQKIGRNEKVDLDHTISAYEIHNDKAVYLANLNGVDLANSDTNLNHTNHSINRSKKQKPMDQFLSDLKSKQAEYNSRMSELKGKSDLTDKERKELDKLTNLSKANAEKMQEADAKARKEYNKAINEAYLKDKKTYVNLGKDAMKQGWKMGARQVLGVLLTEVWVIVRKKFPTIIAKMKEQFSLKEFFLQVGETFKEAFEMVKQKFKTLLTTFANGVLAGILSSVSTFIINFFVGTAKHVVKMIREFWGSITEIFSLIVFNPDHLQPGELIRAISKIIVLAASVIAGTLVAKLVEDSGIDAIPVIGEAIKIFLSGLTTGVISISLVYFIDHSIEVEKLVKYLNTFADQLELKKVHYQQLNEKVKQKVSELSQIPLDELNKQVERLATFTRQMNLATTEDELNSIVSSMVKDMQLHLPYEDRDGLKKFMQDKSLTLHFE
ncbi:hypothetical protein ACLM5H_16925 [Fredinandcohnia humi]